MVMSIHMVKLSLTFAKRVINWLALTDELVRRAQKRGVDLYLLVNVSHTK